MDTNNSEYHHFVDDDPVITLEVLSENPCDPDPTNNEDEVHTNTNPTDAADLTTGLHFLSDETEKPAQTEEKEGQNVQKGRSDTLEYMMRGDGSVVCKLCGEILQSRTHWYRHKYKVHVVHPLNPAPIFQCEQCTVFFKSRKGYIGHLASRHSEMLSDSSPVLTNAQAEMGSNDQVPTVTITPLPLPRPPPVPIEVEMPDPEMAIPKTNVPKFESSAIRQAIAKSVELRRVVRRIPDVASNVNISTTTHTATNTTTTTTNSSEVDEKRTREEKLVADIIARVRQECEAQGPGGPARRGYSRRYTVMHT